MDERGQGSMAEAPGAAAWRGWEPGLHLVLGLPGSGKTRAVLSWMQGLKATEPILVVPARPDVVSYSLDLARGVGTILGRRPVCTFEELAVLVAGSRSRALGALGRSLVHGRLLRTVKLTTLDRVAGLPGVVASCAAVLDELEEGCRRPEDVETCLATWAAAHPEDSLVAHDLATLLTGRRRMLDLLGSPGRIADWRRACETAADWTRPVAVHGFTGFRPAQRRLLLSLGRAVPVLVTLPYQEGRQATAALRREVAGLRAAARRVEELPPNGEPGRALGPAKLVDGFMTSEGRSASTAAQAEQRGLVEAVGEGVTFCLSSGRRNEAELAAREVVRLLRAGFLPDDIVIVVRRVAGWQRLLGQVLGAAGIPYRVDAEVPFQRTGLGYALVEGLRGLVARDEAGLFCYLRSPYAGVSPDRVDDLDSWYQRNSGGDWDALLETTRTSLPATLEDLERAFCGSTGGATKVDPEGLRTLGLAMLARAGKGHSLHSFELAEDVRSFTALQSAVSEMRLWSGEQGGPELSGESGVAVEAAEAISALASLPVHMGGEEAGGVVRVVSAHRARTRAVRAVFILGLVEGEFPESGEASSLLSPRQRAQANAACGIPLFPMSPAGEDALVFLVAASRAGEVLYLSSRDTEEEGEPSIRSPFWEDARGILPSAPLVYRGLDEVVHPLLEAPTHRDYLRGCVSAGLTPPLEDDAKRLVGLTTWRRSSACLSAGLVSGALSGLSVFSASELETYCRCPFSWFISSLLRLEGTEVEFGAAETGTLAHRVLAGVYAALREESRLPLTVASLPRALELAGLHVERELKGVSGLGRREDRIAAAALVRERVDRLLGFDAGSGSCLSPAESEFDVAISGQGVDLGGFALKGRIDRLDTGGSDRLCLIVDYKSGTKAQGPAFAQHGWLQLPLYLMALRVSLPDLSLAGGVYFPLSSGTVAGMVSEAYGDRLGKWAPAKARVGAERFEEELQACHTLAAEAAEGIRAGLIGARPREGECPAWCRLGALCRGPEGGAPL